MAVTFQTQYPLDTVHGVGTTKGCTAGGVSYQRIYSQLWVCLKNNSVFQILIYTQLSRRKVYGCSYILSVIK